MNAKAQPLAAAEPIDAATELAVIPRETALSVLTDPEEFHGFYLRVKAIVDAHVPDVTTAKGREAIKSLAFKVVKSKTAIDDAGKKLTEEWRAQTTKVDAARKEIRDKLDALRDHARRPVTEWEAAEEKRVADVKAQLERLQSAAVVSIEDTVDTVAARLTQIEAVEITDEYFQEYAAAARSHQQATIATLEAALGRLQREASERAELERLRRESAEREQREAAQREQAEAAQQRRQYAQSIIQHIRDCDAGLIGGQPQPYVILLRELEEKVVIDESFGDLEAEARQVLADTLAKLKSGMAREAEERRAREAEGQAERERQAAASAAQEAEERARAEERQRADEAAAEERRQSEARLAGERRHREAAEAEATRLADEQAARERKAAEERAADERRAADVAHRSAIMKAAKEALMEHGPVEEALAKSIVLAIAAGSIPHVTLKF